MYILTCSLYETPSDMKLPEMILTANTSTSDNPDQQVPIKNIAQWTDSSRTIHMKEDIIRGYVYGGKAIPVSGNLIKIHMHLYVITYLYIISIFQ